MAGTSATRFLPFFPLEDKITNCVNHVAVSDGKWAIEQPNRNFGTGDILQHAAS